MNTTNISHRHLPQELLEDILSILPVKSILRFRSVSRSWRSLIDSERFVNTHLQNSRENQTLSNHGVIFNQSKFQSFELKQCSLHSMMNDAVISPSPADPPTGACVVGCSNGIVCIWDWRFYLWNPSTKISIALPTDPCGSWPSNSGFGYDESSGAYKLFVIMPKSRSLSLVKVFSTDTNTWTTRAKLDFGAAPEPGPFMNGNLHWHRSFYRANDVGEDQVIDIVSFGLKSETLGIIEHPSDCKCCVGDWLRLSMGNLVGFLSFARASNDQLNVWIMKEYGVKDSWLKVMALPLCDIYLDDMSRRENEHVSSISLLEVGPNREILMTYKCFFLVYYPKERRVLQLKKIEGLKRLRGAHVFFESLVNPVLKQ